MIDDIIVLHNRQYIIGTKNRLPSSDCMSMINTRLYTYVGHEYSYSISIIDDRYVRVKVFTNMDGIGSLLWPERELFVLEEEKSIGELIMMYEYINDRLSGVYRFSRLNQSSSFDRMSSIDDEGRIFNVRV